MPGSFANVKLPFRILTLAVGGVKNWEVRCTTSEREIAEIQKMVAAVPRKLENAVAGRDSG